MEFLGLTVNTVRLIVKSTSRVNIYYYLPDQLHPMVTFSIDIKNTQKVKNAQQQQLYEIRAMQWLQVPRSRRQRISQGWTLHCLYPRKSAKKRKKKQYQNRYLNRTRGSRNSEIRRGSNRRGTAVVKFETRRTTAVGGPDSCSKVDTKAKEKCLASSEQSINNRQENTNKSPALKSVFWKTGNWRAVISSILRYFSY